MFKKIGLFLAPFLFILLLLIPAPEVLGESAWKVIAIAIFMLIWWVTEAVPIPVAALLPLVLLPLLGVMDMKTAAAPYAHPIVFLFMGGFMIALAMERWELHRRIALNIVNFTGTNANGIILGFMLATALLSMWISNTATTVMMLPIAVSVIQLLSKNRTDGMRPFAISLMLGIAYAANVGGTATIIGTPPNSVLAAYVSKTYNYEISFADWLIVGLPFALILLGLVYLFLVKILYPNKLGKFEGAQELIDIELDRLGRFSRGEILVLIIFLTTAICWILRVPINNLFEQLNIAIELSDAGIAMLASIMLFVTPTDKNLDQFVLEWKDTERLPWGILLLFGGGLSLAGALSSTGIIDLIGGQFEEAKRAGFIIILALAAISLFLTEVMSNVALVTVLLPVIGGVAIGTGIDPLYLMIPVTLAASCAFMLPMSTPPNAIVFASGHLKIAQMVRAGIILNIIAILLIAVLSEYVIPEIFALN